MRPLATRRAPSRCRASHQCSPGLFWTASVLHTSKTTRGGRVARKCQNSTLVTVWPRLRTPLSIPSSPFGPSPPLTRQQQQRQPQTRPSLDPRAIFFPGLHRRNRSSEVLPHTWDLGTHQLEAMRQWKPCKAWRMEGRALRSELQLRLQDRACPRLGGSLSLPIQAVLAATRTITRKHGVGRMLGPDRREFRADSAQDPGTVSVG